MPDNVDRRQLRPYSRFLIIMLFNKVQMSVTTTQLQAN